MKIRDAASTSRVMVVAVMVSMVAFLDSTVVNLALPATTRDLGGGMGLQQWVVDGYLLALGAMILPGGSISDLFGRVPVLRFGLVAFGAGSVLAATAPSPAILIAARVVQGLGAVTITDPVAPARPVSCEVAALCRDRAGAHPALASSGG